MFSKRKFIFAILLTFVLFVSLFGTVIAQTSGFQVQIDQILTNEFPKVQLNLSILNAQGFPITALTSNEISLKEDGKEIDNFSLSTFVNDEEPLAVVILIDTSGSMKPVGNQNPLGDAVAAASNFVDQLSADDYVAVISFADKVTLLQDLTTDKSDISMNLQSLRANGSTVMNDAIVSALNLLTNRSERRAIVLITDGRPDGDQKYNFNNALNLAAARSIPIYPIGFGDVDDEQLQKLAEMSGGIAQVKPDSQELSAAFSSILALFREKYALSYTSLLTADDASHQVEVRMDYQGESQSALINYVARDPIKVEFLQPAVGSVLSGRSDIQISVDTLNPISQVDFYIDDALITSFIDSSYVFSWDTKEFVAGEHTLRIVAHDTLGFETEKTATYIVELPRNERLYWGIGLVVLVIGVIVFSIIRRGKTTKSLQSVRSAVLIELEGLNPGQEWNLKRNIIRLGRKMADNEIHLKGIDASRNQAVVERSKTGFCIRSLKPENPVIVNGESIEQHVLQPGDIIQMGESVFRFEYRN